jgi:hypothetical protein
MLTTPILQSLAELQEQISDAVDAAFVRHHGQNFSIEDI